MKANPATPTIDLAAFEDGSNRNRAEIAARVDRICRETGFLTLTGHGVPPAVIDAVRAATRGFFDQPADVKHACAPPPGGPYGYLGPGAEALAKSKGEETPPDLKESFNGGPARVPDGMTDPQALAFCFTATPFPDLPGFQAAWQAYYAAMEDLAARVMALLAVAMGRPADFFAPFIDAPISALRALNYPQTDRPPLTRQHRAGAHTDYGSLTILLPDPGSRGLQIQTPGGDWAEVTAPDGAFVINIGDLMQVWTGGRWASTLHRVVAPEGPAPRRMSLAFFHQPNWNAEIVPLFGEAASPVISGPYLMGKFAAATAGPKM